MCLRLSTGQENLLKPETGGGEGADQLSGWTAEDRCEMGRLALTGEEAGLS